MMHKSQMWANFLCELGAEERSWHFLLLHVLTARITGQLYSMNCDFHWPLFETDEMQHTQQICGPACSGLSLTISVKSQFILAEGQMEHFGT